MTTGTVIPVSEYLHTLYRPDCDYVDGVVEERNLGELDHSELQVRLLRLFGTEECRRYFRVNAELRVQVGATRFRVPDVCLRSVAAPREQILRTPPLLCIEVLSPEDTLTKMRERVRDFLDMGVSDVWIVDPATRTVHLCTTVAVTPQAVGTLAVPNTPVTLNIEDIFSVLDEM